ncbi:U-box domain-containing protein 35-like [Abrus precatorius]|uniref:U-box domain-containing protein 35-like n=1 Tax=Abrus precatorius TaxID=3816 RepID=A0A8B8K3D6_ABRPR|nr:U-box domain-containing protein 35-like [Abrus precatorius]
MSKEKGDECLQNDFNEETASCTCGFIGFRRNQVFDCSQSCNNREISNVNEDSEELFEINLKEPLDTISEDCESSVFSFDIHNHKDIVHVAVDHAGESSMEALLWTLKHAVTPSTTVCLIHIFPEIRLIPSPFGKIPRSHVKPEYVDFYLAQKKGQRKLLLQRFIDICIDSKVNVEVLLIEDNNVAKAIVDLVNDLSIRKLVIGITKYTLRRRNAIADKVLKNAPEICDVKIICNGKEVIDQMIGCTSSYSSDISSSRVSQEGDESHRFVPLIRFIPNPICLFRPGF